MSAQRQQQLGLLPSPRHIERWKRLIKRADNHDLMGPIARGFGAAIRAAGSPEGFLAELELLLAEHAGYNDEYNAGYYDALREVVRRYHREEAQGVSK